jgi:CBS domain-containing protein
MSRRRREVGMKIAEIGKLQNVKLQTIAPEKTILDASRKLVQYNIGALPVCDADGGLVGIITERDILRVTAKDGGDGVGHKVAAIMSRQVYTCVADDDIETAMQVMTDQRVRHLPVLRDGRLVNIISIGDLVKATLDESQEENRHLRSYVAG